jgi:hypothetical protein
MNKPVSNQVKRGQAISFRVPSDTPDHLLKHLQKLKETERRNFSSKIAEFVMQGVSQSLSREKEMISIPLPHSLTKAQRNWLKHEHSEALLGSIIYQLLTEPARAASLLATLNSNSLNLDDALYLQEEGEAGEAQIADLQAEANAEQTASDEGNKFKDDIDSFKLKNEKEDHAEKTEKEEDSSDDDLDSLLGDFLAEMNK